MKKKRKNTDPNRETNRQKQQQNWRVASSNGFTCAPGLSGIPDVTSASTGNDTSLDEVSEESDKEGLLIFLKTLNHSIWDGRSSVRCLCFCYQLTDNLVVKWDAVLLEKTLYVQVPDAVFLQGSRDSMVALLDAAEEQYQCERVIVCFKRKRLDAAQLIKTFRFMGFMVVPPGHPYIPATEEYFFMAYQLD